MTDIHHDVLQAVIAESAEPILIVRTDQMDWPVALANPAFASISKEEAVGRAFAELIGLLVSRAFALDVSEAVRSHRMTGVPVEVAGREYLLAVRPIDAGDDGRYVALFWRDSTGRAAIDPAETQAALQTAKRRIRNLRREDPLTGLLNERTFREILAHDWAVAAREQATLALVVFTLDEFDAYLEVFGRHAADSCLRRVGQTVQRFLKRASDVVARVDDSKIAVLSHASDESGVAVFAERIATAVRELGIHHPRSRQGRFVTVTYRVGAMSIATGAPLAGEFLDELLSADG